MKAKKTSSKTSSKTQPKKRRHPSEMPPLDLLLIVNPEYAECCCKINPQIIFAERRENGKIYIADEIVKIINRGRTVILNDAA